ncbi:hypothetical protein JD844_018343 [Phrynosoma platyrhinos]|uniref:Uncharacterized protein n=1 Tax=Phrynosoma platyrhinos TaxID=52577 RepID=A0ABQ7SNG3_PHRPL|nr:hypothetical protein JD844_018343 [Phrynosoma platyrhinos]
MSMYQLKVILVVDLELITMQRCEKCLLFLNLYALAKSVAPDPTEYQASWIKQQKRRPAFAPFSSRSPRFSDDLLDKECFPGYHFSFIELECCPLQLGT